MPTRVRSHSKINLGLAVGPPRADGFHALTTLYQTLELHDIVTVEARRAAVTTVVLSADHPGVPCTAKGDAHRNTAYRMVEQALRRIGVTAEVHVRLEKELPVQGGLGAGSANAVAALLGLERELGVALAGPERLELAAEVGSDVPLFLLGGTVLGLDRGQDVYPMPDAASLPVVVAIPRVGVSTAQAFRELDRRAAGEASGSKQDRGLTSAALDDKLHELGRVLASAWTFTGNQTLPGDSANGISAGRSGGGPNRAATGGAPLLNPSLEPMESPQPEKQRASGGFVHGEMWVPGNEEAQRTPLLSLLRAGLVNDFEDVAFAQHPSLRALKQALAGAPRGSTTEPVAAAEAALYAALSGSGSALFGIYGSAAAARAAQARVEALGAGAVLTRTLPRDEYWQSMFV